MRGGQRNQIIAIITIAIITAGCIIGLGLAENEGDFLVNFGGYFYVSDIQDHHSNSSYSIIFHEVNFTFLYWYWPEHSVYNNVTAFLAEQTVSVYVNVTFTDLLSEILVIQINSPGSCYFAGGSILRGMSSNHWNPKAGIATAQSEELYDSWVYVVSM